MIFVVDSADKDRVEVARQELELMLQEEELKGVPVLVLANKQDLPNALNEQEVLILRCLNIAIDLQRAGITCYKE